MKSLKINPVLTHYRIGMNLNDLLCPVIVVCDLVKKCLDHIQPWNQNRKKLRNYIYYILHKENDSLLILVFSIEMLFSWQKHFKSCWIKSLENLSCCTNTFPPINLVKYLFEKYPYPLIKNWYILQIHWFKKNPKKVNTFKASVNLKHLF